MLLSTKASEFVLSGIKGNGVKVETGYFNGEEWVKTTDKARNDREIPRLMGRIWRL